MTGQWVQHPDWRKEAVNEASELLPGETPVLAVPLERLEPKPPNPPAFGSLIWYACLIEIVGGVLLILGLLTRLAAFFMAGEMAFAYFISHSPRSIYPIQNGGNLAILYCFVFFYLVFAGPGPWSVDAKRFANP